MSFVSTLLHRRHGTFSDHVDISFYSFRMPRSQYIFELINGRAVCFSSTMTSEMVRFRTFLHEHGTLPIREHIARFHSDTS